MNKKPLLVGLLVVIALAVVLFFAFPYFKSKLGSNQQKSTVKVEQRDLPLNQVPQGFRADLPMPGGAELSQNYEADSSDGRKQSARVFSTKESATSILALYKNYFVKLGWTDYSKEGEAIVLLRKNDDTVLISTQAQNSDEKMTEVRITLTQSPPKPEEVK